ncbi:MAG TPA: M48 family metalloprotease [Flavobacterium sp.]|nr:M48 family metalloprotease [Flavobacterium sp.]
MCQTDIPVKFIKRGFAQNIDYEQKLILVNFAPDPDDKKVTNYEITSETLELKDPQITNENNDKLTIKDLKSSEEILIEGQRFREANYNQINKITIVGIKVKPVKGRIDLIRGDFAYVNGNKIKLKAGEEIKGKEGFSGNTYKSVNAIAEGDLASVSGKYNPEGYYLADDFSITPEDETAYDKAALAMEKEDYDKLYPIWTDKTQREKLFGNTIPGLGKITKDKALQEYVNMVGLKLVPQHIQKKIHFIFIVVDNPDLLAYVRPNGLAYVCTGLLKNLENEAQLATVLGHEISHAIYEHQAEVSAKSDSDTKTKDKIKGWGKGIISAVNGKNKGDAYRSGKGKIDEEKSEEKEKSNIAMKDNMVDLSGNYVDKRSSDFTVEQEYLADRVGLCLMVLAGYDPREAPIVWKNIFELYGVKTPVKEGVAITEVLDDDVVTQSKTAENKGVNIFVRWKAEDYKAKSTKTHPDELRRFEALNRLIALYWNNTDLLAKTENGEAKYVAMKRRIRKG